MRFIILLVLIPFISRAQEDSAIAVPLIGIHFSGQLPSGDLVNRFGLNLNVGGSFLYKTKKNWLLGFEANYMFGSNVKEDVLIQLKTPDGFVIDNEGYPADIRLTERGLGLHLIGGRVFKLPGLNKNSGLVLNAGIGYLQTRIHIYDANKKVAAIKDNLVFGYDRLSGGLSLCQFFGFFYMGDNRMSNFYFGLEFYEAFTKSVRKLNYDTGAADTQPRLDIISGVRVGWILPLYKKTPNDFYYN